MEVKTVSDLVRKQKETKSAITEQADTASSKIGVCPRVVAVSKDGRNARVPVKIFNMSAKVLTTPPRSLLCQLQVVKALRSCNPLSDKAKTAKPTSRQHIRLIRKASNHFSFLKSGLI